MGLERKAKPAPEQGDQGNMPIQEKSRIFDGFTSLAGGQDSGRDATVIDKNQAHKLNNVICRGGVGGETRPPFKSHALEFERRNTTYLASGLLNTVQANDVPDQSATNFHGATFQDASYFAPRGTPACIMVMVGGRQYKLTPKQFTGIKVSEVQLDYRNRSTIPQAYMQQADRFHITQDGESKPIIFDGVKSRRAKEREVPVGKQMAYGMGRLCVTVNGREIEFSDLYGSNKGTDPGDAVIMFTETTFLNEGFNASIAFSLGAIVGLHFAPQQDSAVGDGELLAFSENGVSSFFLSQPRENWKDSAFQRVTLLGIGGRGHSMIVSFNGDLWFRSDDGWRSYRQARAEIQGWAHLPMSTEVRDYMIADTPRLLRFGSAINFNNRLISTCTPRSNQGRTYNNGLLALDFDVLSSFGQATKPAWDGHWDKLKFLKLVSGKFNGVNRAFAFAIDAAGKNQVYELMPEPGGEDFDGPINCTIEGRAMDFASPFNEKEIMGGDVWVDSVNSEVVITASYKCDQQPDWQQWQTLNVIAASGECQAITCGGVPTIKPGYFPRKTLVTPLKTCNDQTKRLATRFFDFQPRLTWSGHCVINRLRLSATALSEDSRAICP